MVRHGGEPLLVLSQRQQQVGDAIGWRKLRIRGRHAEAVHPPSARRDEQGAALTHEPGTERPAREREPGGALKLALAVAEQIAEEALRHGLAGAAPRAFGRTTDAPLNAYSSGMIQAWASAASATGAASGSSHIIPAAAAMNGTV